MTLHHIADTGAILEKLNALLRPGGMIALADLDLEDGFFHDDPGEEVHHGFERSALQRILGNGRLQIGFVRYGLRNTKNQPCRRQENLSGFPGHR